jgi:hypothetical protein
MAVSVLEIRHESVSWIRDCFATVAAGLCQVTNYLPPAPCFRIAICLFWLVECHR